MLFPEALVRVLCKGFIKKYLKCGLDNSALERGLYWVYQTGHSVTKS